MSGRPQFARITRNEVKTVLGKVNSIREKALLVLYLATGYRISELLSIRIRDVASKDGEILKYAHVRKINNGRSVLLNSDTQKILKEFVDHLKGLGFSDDSPLFISRKHSSDGNVRIISRQHAWSILKELFEMANMKIGRVEDKLIPIRTEIEIEKILMSRDKNCRSWFDFCDSIDRSDDWLNNMDLSNANLAGVNLRRAYLIGVNFSGADLSYADLRAAEVCGSNFSGALLEGALINGANLYDEEIEDAFDVPVELDKETIEKLLRGRDKDCRSWFDFCRSINQHPEWMQELDLREMNLSGINFYGADLFGTNFFGSDLTGCNLSKTDLSEAELGSANLSNTNLSNSKVISTDLDDITNFEGADLSGAYFVSGIPKGIDKLGKVVDTIFKISDVQLIKLVRIYASDFEHPKIGKVDEVQMQIIKLVRSFLQEKNFIAVNLFDNNYFELLKSCQLSPSQIESLNSILMRLGIVQSNQYECDHVPSHFISASEVDFSIHSSFKNNLMSDFLDFIKSIPGCKFDKERKTHIIPQNHESLKFLFRIMVERKFEFTPLTLDKIASIIDALRSQSDNKISFDGDDLLLTYRKGNSDDEIQSTIRDEILGSELLSDGDIWKWRIRSSVLTTKGISSLHKLTNDLDIYVKKEVDYRLQNISRGMKENMNLSYAHDSDEQIPNLGGELKPFQRAGVAYVIRNKKTIIADEMGLGKTIQALATLEATSAFPALVVCPASLKLNWLYEVRKWLNRSSIIFDNSFTNPDYDITIINYESLAKIMTGKGKYATPEFTFKGLIFDEFHYVKNPKAIRTVYAKLIAEKAEICLGLTGTPVLSRPIELVSQLDILGRLNEMGGMADFKYHFCCLNDDKKDYSGAKNLIELNEKLRATCYVRREKKDVLKELPPKQSEIIYLELDNRSEYDAAEENLLEWLSSKGKEKERASAENALQLVKYEYLKQLAVAGKLNSIMEWIESFLESGEKLIVFATHKEVVKNINNRFKNSLLISGDTPQEKRQGIANQFQDDPETKLIVINMKTGGVGFTLTASSNVVFCEMGWTPADHHQAEDRCHRIGQTDIVNSWYLLAPDSIDMDIYEVVMVEKLKVVTNATKGNEELRVETISILERLSQLFEARMRKKKEEYLYAKENKLEQLYKERLPLRIPWVQG